MNKNKKKFQNILIKSLKHNSIVDIHRKKIDEFSVRGIILSCNDHYAVISILNEYLFINGISVIFISDITSVEISKNNKFYQNVIKKRKNKVNLIPKINSLNIGELLVLLCKKFNIITIHQEKTSPDTCIIGRILSLSENKLSLLTISPRAIFAKQPVTLDLKSFTKIDAGGEYEKSLLLVSKYPL